MRLLDSKRLSTLDKIQELLREDQLDRDYQLPHGKDLDSQVPGPQSIRSLDQASGDETVIVSLRDSVIPRINIPVLRHENLI